LSNSNSTEGTEPKLLKTNKLLPAKASNKTSLVLWCLYDGKNTHHKAYKVQPGNESKIMSVDKHFLVMNKQFFFYQVLSPLIFQSLLRKLLKKKC